MTGAELVLVVDRMAFFGGRWPQGLVPLAGAAAADLLGSLEAAARFVPRPAAEDDPSLKQLIPYCALVTGTEVFCVERLRTQGEARLHGRLSIGIGGHIGPEDSPPAGAVRRGLWRELNEELVLPTVPLADPRFVGLLNDDSNPVGAVHVGLVHLLELGAGTGTGLGVREISKMAGAFRRLADPGNPWQDAARLETWSAALLAALPPLLEPRAGGHPDGSDSRTRN
ncbi:MAG: phosphoesterase [Planctomycetes bacterium]|nr:phosphoesterase [Planctomycetota bacterium]